MRDVSHKIINKRRKRHMDEAMRTQPPNKIPALLTLTIAFQKKNLGFISLFPERNLWIPPQIFFLECYSNYTGTLQDKISHCIFYAN